MENMEDHPRIRGTNFKKSFVIKTIAGSPPHTRDKSSFIFVIANSIGITPAYAGQIPISQEFPVLPEDHPRIRGTNT